MKSKGHTLWLVPIGDAFEKFNTLIQKLAKEYNAPVFCPHVTLLGDFPQPEGECIAKTKELISNQKPFVIETEEIGYEDFFFRTLFVRAKISTELQQFHDRSKTILDKQDIPPYMAHLSILYGTFPVEIKEKIIKEIGREQKASWEVNKVTLVRGGEVNEWKIICEFPLIG